LWVLSLREVWRGKRKESWRQIHRVSLLFLRIWWGWLFVQVGLREMAERREDHVVPRGCEETPRYLRVEVGESERVLPPRRTPSCSLHPPKQMLRVECLVVWRVLLRRLMRLRVRGVVGVGRPAKVVWKRWVPRWIRVKGCVLHWVVWWLRWLWQRVMGA